MFERHPLSAAFPSMSPEEQNELTLDIELNGLRDPVVLYQGKILDGWHRYQSCVALCIIPDSIQFSGDNPVAYVISKNIHRRSLTGSQRAAAIVACSSWAKSGRPEKGEVASPFLANDEMAKAAGVSTRTIQHAKAATSAGLGDEIKNGNLTAEQAAAISKLPEEERQAAIDNPKLVNRERKPTPEPIPVPPPVDVSPPEDMITVSRADYEEMVDTLESLNQSQRELEEIFMADDKLVVAGARIKQLEGLNAVLQSRLNGELNKNAELVRIVNRKDKIIAKLEKSLEALQMEALPV